MKVCLNSLPLTLVASLLLCCGRSERVHGARPSEVASEQPQGTIITTRDGARFFGDDAAIDAYYYDTPGFTNRHILQFLGGNGADTWTAQTQVPLDILPSGSGSATLQKAPLALGVANVERMRSGLALHQGASGTFTYAFTDGNRVSVDVSGDSNLISATVEASFQVRCWVKTSELGQEANGQGEGVSMALDERFETSMCAPFRQYGP